MTWPWGNDQGLGRHFPALPEGFGAMLGWVQHQASVLWLDEGFCSVPQRGNRVF